MANIFSRKFGDTIVTYDSEMKNPLGDKAIISSIEQVIRDTGMNDIVVEETNDSVDEEIVEETVINGFREGTYVFGTEGDMIVIIAIEDSKIPSHAEFRPTNQGNVDLMPEELDKKIIVDINRINNHIYYILNNIFNDDNIPNSADLYLVFEDGSEKKLTPEIVDLEYTKK